MKKTWLKLVSNLYSCKEKKKLLLTKPKIWKVLFSIEVTTHELFGKLVKPINSSQTNVFKNIKLKYIGMQRKQLYECN